MALPHLAWKSSFFCREGLLFQQREKRDTVYELCALVCVSFPTLFCSCWTVIQITSLHTPFSGKTWQVPHFFDHLPSPLLVLSCPAWHQPPFSRGCSGQGACLYNCPIRTAMPLWRLKENESPIIIQETNVPNFSRRSSWYIIMNRGKMIYCKLAPFPFV